MNDTQLLTLLLANKPLPTLYSKGAGGAVVEWQIKTYGGSVCTRWGQVGGAVQEAAYTAKPKNVGRANATTAEEQARLEAISKWRSQLKKKYSVDPSGASTRTVRPMLATALEPGTKLACEFWVQPKLDGVRCLAYLGSDGTVILSSRGGDFYEIPHISAGLAPALIKGAELGVVALDGEVYCHGIDFQTLTSWIKRPQADTHHLAFHAYDCIADTDAGFALRHMWVQQLRQVPAADFVCLRTEHVPQQKALAYSIDSAMDEAIADGYEGLILRLRSCMYRMGARSKDLVKVKRFEDAEFIVVGWKRGKGKYANTPIFKCVTAAGAEFDCMCVGDVAAKARQLQEADTYVGEYLVVTYQGLSEAGIPRFPVGKGLRPAADQG